VEVGVLDEADLESTMAQMTEEELEAQRRGELPDWLQELLVEEEAPSVEVVTPTVEPGAAEQVDEPVVAEALEGVPQAEAAREEEDLPEWLREAVEVDLEEATEPVIVEEEEELPEAEVAPEEEPPEWLPEAVEPEPELAADEQAEEALVATRAIPVLVDEPAEDIAIVEEAAPLPRVDELLALLKDRPRNYKARLELARLFCAEGAWDAAMDHYQKLVSARKFLPAVIDDLTPLAEEAVDLARLYQLQGDALMEDDRLDDALEMYRKAKQALMQR
jgi:tetratricopeptide (TPR) repeat protein